MISNFRSVLELALRRTPGVDLLSWDQSQESWLRVPVVGERTRFLRVAPDARFSLRQAGQVRHFFLEMDGSTEEHARLLLKFQGYWWYLQSPAYLQAHAIPRRVNVLFVTTGQQRMLNMMKTLRELRKPNRADHGGKDLFWFCVEGDYDLGRPNPLLRPIWRASTLSGAQGSFLTPD